MSVVFSRLIALQDSRSRALVYPERGFQLFGFETEIGGRRVESIYVPPGDIEPADRRYGNPVLFPAVGVSNGAAPDSWSWQGRPLPMPPHGWARNVYWQVEKVDGQSLTAVVVPHPGFRLGFPFDFSLRITYRLVDGTLVCDSELANLGEVAFPYAYGFHPYLRAPLGDAPAHVGAGDRCQVSIPAGTRLSPADGWKSFTAQKVPARVVSTRDLDLAGSIVMTDLPGTALEVQDQDSGLAARISVAESEQNFPVWVIWNASPEAPYVCLEPWTDAPNALNRAGTRTLAPGGKHRYRLTLSVREL